MGRPEPPRGLLPVEELFALERMRHLGASRYMLPWKAAEIDEVFGGDPRLYGVERTAPSIDAMIRFMA